MEIARKAMLEEAEKLECEEVREALKYFMNECWRDTARPALLSVACESLGGDPDITIPIAVPLILIGGAVDIHDDIIDKTEIKRAYPTIYGKFGKDIALLVGDALLFKGLTLLHEAAKEIKPEKIYTIFKILKKFFFELGDAEAYEVALRGKKTLKIEEYMEFVKKKAAEFEAYMRISAILADASGEQIETLGKFGRILGMLVILGDDNADMLDYGEMISRIKNEVLPLPIISALRKPHLKKKLMPILQSKELTKKDAEKIFNIIYTANIFGEVEENFMRLIDEGRDILKNITNTKWLTQILESTYPKNEL
ncbi:MAG: polyprenyl synthetase family protein [Candidatus Bathyarchaeia archaeon]